MNSRRIFNFTSLCVAVFILFGCSTFSSIQNIRKIDSTKKSLKDNNLTFMTFNIRVGGGRDNPGMSPYYLTSSRKKIDKIALAIKSIDPDIISLQEVKGFYQGKQLAKKLNLNYAYIPHSNWWGLAMLSKCTILKVYSKYTHVGDDPRIALVSVIDINGKHITFVNVHYHLGDYEQQVNATMKVLRGISEPVVLMGDLNRTQYHWEIKPIQDELTDTCLVVDTEGSDYVKRAGTGFGRIDYIFVSPESFEVKDVGIAIDHWDASDHYAYFANVTLKDK